MKAYSLDLRERVIAALEEGELTQPEIAETYDISLRTVETWAHQWRATQSLAPKPHRSGPPRTLQPCGAVIRRALADQPDLTLAELCEHVAAQTHVRGNTSMMCRELQHLKLPRKKVLARQPARHPARAKAAVRISAGHPRPPARYRRPAQIHR